MIRNRNRRPFEFQRNGPIARPVGHKPDFTLSISRKNTQNIQPRSVKSPRKQSSKKQEGVVDRLFFVDLVGKTNISELKHVDASSKKLTGVDISIFKEMESLTSADFSDNKLPLEPFSVLPKLEELDLSCNSLKQFDYQSSELMAEDSRAWGELKKLNLSFNYASPYVSELQYIPHLADLNLSHNSISGLPPNLMHFTCLTHLNLTGNSINTDQNFFSLATISALQVLILDDNKITTIPHFNFGFESLVELSLKRNNIEFEDDISSLIEINSLTTVNIANNPIVLRSKNLAALRKLFSTTQINLYIEDKPNKVVKKALPPNVRTVNFDPLTLPTFTKQHIKALNKGKKRLKSAKSSARRTVNQQPQLEEEEEKEEDVDHNDIEIIDNIKPRKRNAAEDAASVFITISDTKKEEERAVEMSQPIIEPTELPEEKEEEGPIRSIWKEVPVVQASERVVLTENKRPKYNLAFKKLEFLVQHPDLRLRPRESPSQETEEEIATKTRTFKKQLEDAEDRSIFRGTSQMPVQKKKPVQDKLAARTEYTKTEVQKMLQSMADRLNLVERDLGAADDTGQMAVDIALDQKNFSNLQKQYETIRAELINTLNSV